ncbi:hypothetical protein VNI00_006114 [Paramarasmius palmivorus]|uniref:C2H2-type domain-containing protein n=1 Tax=Paramarasmius palmivorus TaxID=297713 RepID=A0AAW0D4Z2_9AGAR
MTEQLLPDPNAMGLDMANFGDSQTPNNSSTFVDSPQSATLPTPSTSHPSSRLSEPDVDDDYSDSPTPSELSEPPPSRARRRRTKSVSDKSEKRPRPFMCQHPNCDRTFTSSYTRETHMISHRPKRKQSYQCTVGCGALFSRKHDRWRHEVSQHGKPTDWTCTRCCLYFSSEKMLLTHDCDRTKDVRWKNHTVGVEE